jgi:hypothetical protein
MTGSTAVLIVVPIVALLTLAFWLGLVYYVGAHPEWRGHQLEREAREREVQARQLAAAVAADQAALGDTGPEARAPGLDQAARDQAARRRGGGQTRITPRAA